MAIFFNIWFWRFRELLDRVVIIIDSYKLDLVTPISHYFSQMKNNTHSRRGQHYHHLRSPSSSRSVLEPPTFCTRNSTMNRKTAPQWVPLYLRWWPTSLWNTLKNEPSDHHRIQLDFGEDTWMTPSVSLASRRLKKFRNT